MNRRTILTILITSTIVTRLIFGLVYYHNKTTDFWEYGTIANNIISGKGYSLFYIEQNEIKIENSYQSHPNPSAYMMPGYVLFILPFMMSIKYSQFLIFLIQALIAGLTVFYLYRLTQNLFGMKTALTAGIIFALLPEFIYSSNTIGPTTIFHFLIISFLTLTMKNDAKIVNFYLLGLISVLMIYFRPESALFLLIYLFYVLIKKEYSKALIIILFCIAGLSPWIIRNMVVFNKFIPLTNSTGINFYRGHNPYYSGFWMDEEIHKQILNIKETKFFETRMNEIYIKQSTEYIKKNPSKEIISNVDKIWQLWIFNPIDKRSQYPIYFAPWLIILAFSIISIFGEINYQKLKYIYFFLICSTLSVVIFFALPRYQTLMKIAIIPIAANGIMMIVNRFKRSD